MFCKNCGNEIKSEAKFCDKCGTQIINSDSEHQNTDIVNGDNIILWVFGYLKERLEGNKGE